jgi:RNA polymerase sigma factor (sigma-70 family)
MPDEEERWQTWIRGLRAGDSQIVHEFCQRYGTPLQEFADKHLAGGMRRRVGASDIVQSAYRTFLRHLKAGEFLVADNEGLWRLLCAITLTKVRNQVRYHQRPKRRFSQDVSLTALSPERDEGSFDPVDPGPTPAEAAEFADQFRQLMESFADDEERQLVLHKLDQCTNVEVAQRMGLSERTVRRIHQRVKARLERALQNP